MISADNFFMHIQATEQPWRCTSRALLYKMITRKDITYASDILRQEEVQTVRDSTYESQQVSWKYDSWPLGHSVARSTDISWLVHPYSLEISVS